MKNLPKSSNVIITGGTSPFDKAMVRNLIGRDTPETRIFGGDQGKQDKSRFDTQDLNYQVYFNNEYESLLLSELDTSSKTQQSSVSETADLISRFLEFMKYGVGEK